MSKEMEIMANFDKKEIRKKQSGQMWRTYRKDKKHKTGLHSAEETEQLIISHKRKHNEKPPPPPTTVLPILFCSHHTNTYRHTLVSFLSTSRSRDDRIILNK